MGINPINVFPTFDAHRIYILPLRYGSVIWLLLLVNIIAQDVNLDLYQDEVNIIVDKLTKGEPFFVTENLMGRWEGNIIWIEPRKVVKEENTIIVSKEIEREGNFYRVNIYLRAEEKGLYYVEENVPKGEINLQAFHAILNFDPVVVWLVSLDKNEEITLSYRVKSILPPQLSTEVVRLGTCNVRVEFRNLVMDGGKVNGEFVVYVGDAPAYVPNVRVNGKYEFVRDGMYYVFSADNPVVVEGSVGDCSFYKEKRMEENSMWWIVAVAVLLVALFLLFSKHL